MRPGLFTPHSMGALVLAGIIGVLPGVTCAVTPAGVRLRPVASGLSGGFCSVAATSSRNAWAVGSFTKGSSEYTLTAHWDGTRWRRVPSPSPGVDAALTGVAAFSGGVAWAVGVTDQVFGAPPKSVILRWDGTAWRQVPAAYPRDTVLSGVAAFAGGGAWATGEIPQYRPTPPPTFIARWDGTAWQRVRGVRPAHLEGGLSGVAATSARNAWAAGSTTYYPPIEHRNGTSWQPTVGTFNGGFNVPLIEHWNGTSWQPTAGTFNGGFSAVSAASARNAWAVGAFYHGLDLRTLTEHWDGTAWQRIPSPSPGHSAQLFGVAAVTARDAWALGDYYTATTGWEVLMLHWDGSAWQRVRGVPLGVPPGVLCGIAAVSARDVWAVGGSSTVALILHWNGTRWQRVPAP